MVDIQQALVQAPDAIVLSHHVLPKLEKLPLAAGAGNGSVGHGADAAEAE
jgi:hypothetical protein